jgi:hypothetical protein
VDASPDGRKRIYRIRPEGSVHLDQWLKRYLAEGALAGHRAKRLSRSRSS